MLVHDIQMNTISFKELLAIVRGEIWWWDFFKIPLCTTSPIKSS